MKKLLLAMIFSFLGLILCAQPSDTVNIGTGPNQGDGDPLRTAFIKLNANDIAIYDTVPYFENRMDNAETAITTHTTKLTDIYYSSDSTGIQDFLVVNDSVFLKNFKGGGNLRFLTLKDNGAIDTAVLDPLGAGLTMVLIPAGERLADLKDGEIGWFRYNKATGEVFRVYLLKADMMTIQSLILEAEYALRYLDKHDQEIEALKQEIASLKSVHRFKLFNKLFNKNKQ